MAMRHKAFAAMFAAAGMVLIGCDSGTTTAENERFIGVWQYTGGTETETCPAPIGVATTKLQGTLEIRPGIDAPIAIVGGTCVILLDVSGNTATARPGQPCALTDGDITQTLTIMNLSYVLNGLTATETSASTAVFARGAQMLTCTLAATGTLKKVAK
jgi:environmental stress-induced protein Ves